MYVYTYVLYLYLYTYMILHDSVAHLDPNRRPKKRNAPARRLRHLLPLLGFDASVDPQSLCHSIYLSSEHFEGVATSEKLSQKQNRFPISKLCCLKPLQIDSARDSGINSITSLI